MFISFTYRKIHKHIDNLSFCLKLCQMVGEEQRIARCGLRLFNQRIFPFKLSPLEAWTVYMFCVNFSLSIQVGRWGVGDFGQGRLAAALQFAIHILSNRAEIRTPNDDSAGQSACDTKQNAQKCDHKDWKQTTRSNTSVFVRRVHCADICIHTSVSLNTPPTNRINK